MTQKQDAAAQQDIIIDIMQRVRAMLAQPPATQADADRALAQLEKDVRATWGGDRPYIAHRSGDGHSERNSRIWRAWQQGQHISYMARKEGISPRRVEQIVREMRPARPPRPS